MAESHPENTSPLELRKKSSIEELAKRLSIAKEERTSMARDRGMSSPKARRMSKNKRASLANERRASVSNVKRMSVATDKRISISNDITTSVSKDRRTSVSKDRTSVSRDRRTSVSRDRRTSVSRDRRTSVSKDRASVSKDRTSVSKDRRTSFTRERRTSVSRDRKPSIAREKRQSFVEDKRNVVKSIKPRPSILRSRTSLKKFGAAEKSISFPDPATERRKICMGLLMDILNKSVTISEDKPDHVAKEIQEEITERVLEESDIETIANRVVSDVIDSLSSKHSIEEDVVSGVMESVISDLRSISEEEFNVGSIDFVTVEEEIRVRLENMVSNAMKKSQIGIIEDVLDDILETATDGTSEEKVLYSTTRFSTRPSEAASEFEAVEEEEPDQTCVEFMGYEAVAEDLLEKVTDSTQEYIGEKCPTYYAVSQTKDEIEDDFDEESENEDYEEAPYVEVFEKKCQDTVIWPKIKEFNTDEGKTTIYEYLETWYFSEDWLYCVNHVGCLSDLCSDFYYYEAIWSIPLPSYPIPQATATVYFTIEVSRVIPPTCPVNVSYQFEGTRFVHKPGKIEFQEDWLFNIIDAKIAFFKTLTF